MKRDIDKISSDVLDVFIVGGGIHGAAIAYHASKEGYRTAIVDKNDFCGATSANSLKILHGGLRYLQHGNVKRMRHSILSRREMMCLAPYLVEPLPCMMPIYGTGLRGTMAMRTALFINDCVSWDRNQGLPEELHLPQGHIVSEEKCREVIPGIGRKGLHGAAVWYDVLAMDTERLVLEYILESVRYDAQAANYTEVIGVENEDDKIYSVTVADKFAKRTHKIRTRFVVNASGPWFENSFFLPGEEQNSETQQWALALNVVSKKKIFDDYGVALEGQGSYQDKDALVKRDKRLYFFVPWRGYTMIGTEYEASLASPDDLQVKQETIQKMVDEINAIYPQAQLKYEDISFFHAGLLPMRSNSEPGSVQLEKNSTFAECGKNGLSRIISLKSVKYTTAPRVAHEVVDYLKKQSEPSNTAPPKGFLQTEEKWSGNDPELKGFLKNRYGPRAMRVLHYMNDNTENDPWIGGYHQLTKAEVRYLVAEEMACSLSDIVLRRTGIGTAECPSKELLYDTAAYMGNILGWNEAEKEREVEDVLHRYFPLVSKDS